MKQNRAVKQNKTGDSMKILENIKSKLTIFAEFICKSFPLAAGSGQREMKNSSFHGNFVIIHSENV